VHTLGTVIAQCRVANKANESSTMGPLLRDVDVRGAVVTGDAMFAQRGSATHLVEDKQADYLFTVKDNQPTLRADIEALSLVAVSPSRRTDRQRSRSHRNA
jgi:predicted transposase YbfD/YdcC